ncbi:MAG TPA: methionyl-tRNA formyltransferase [Dongiaceae bacterium]|jgi:methionyl-tRNA formyltransferase|nr:methionyl-tRNA formyltransferase [Dongiaceae bacterium]
MGTPDFAVPALAALHATGLSIEAVYTQPPRPAGRGMAARKSPVHIWAENHGLAVRTPTSLKSMEDVAAFRACAPDLAVVAAYGLLLPRAILEAPRLGCWNIHASLLPRWRGAAPIQRAILAGDEVTGISLMQMEEGLDTGPVLLQRALPIAPSSDARQVHDALAALGAQVLLEALAAPERLVPHPQEEGQALYAAKLRKSEGEIDWNRPAAEINRHVRAFTPWPSAFTHLPGREILKIQRATIIENMQGKPGTILDAEMTVACGTGALRLDLLQRAGRKSMSGADFLRGGVTVGTVLG